MRGLQVRVFDGSAAFYLYYRTRSGAQRKPKLADVRDVSLPQIRKIANRWIAAVVAGKDPSRSRKAARRAATVAQIYERWMAEQVEVHRKKETIRQIKQVWRLIIEPAIGERKCFEVSRADIQSMHTANKRRPIMANRALAHCSSLMKFAEQTAGARAENTNPCRGIERFKEVGRKRYPIGDEPQRLFQALDEMEENEPIFVAYIILLCITGCRATELRTAKRKWVKADGLHLPDTKTGPDIVRLSDAAREIIAGLPVLKGNPYMFPGHKRGRPIIRPTALWGKLLERAGIDDLTLHDLRRFFASAGLSAGSTLEGVGQLLRHKSAATTKGYAFLMEDAAQAAANAASDAVMKRVGRDGRD